MVWGVPLLDWVLSMNEDLLSKIDGVKVNSFTTILTDKNEGRFKEETNFKILLENNQGEISESPVLQGKHYSGRGKHYRPWIEFDFTDKINFESSSEILSDYTLQKLFQTTSSIIPAGGWIFVVYERHEKTEKGLNKLIPPAATRIGFFLYKSGCVWFKNWYFAEGGKEGRKKLQGEKPQDEKIKRKSLARIYQELVDFQNTLEDTNEEIFINGRERAKKVMKEIEEEIPNLEAKIKETKS